MRIKALTKDLDKQALIKRLSDQKAPLMFFYNVRHLVDWMCEFDSPEIPVLRSASVNSHS